MMRPSLETLHKYGGLIAGICLLTGLLTIGLMARSATPETMSRVSLTGTLSEDRKSELQHFLDHDCGSCHGMTRKGGLGSALDAASLKDRSDETLVAIILDGIPGTPMPPWRPLLSETEALWIVHQLREETPNESGS